AAYVVLAALGAPALTALGVPVLAAHLFIFYFGCMSNVTPPVALAAYAAAGMAEAAPLRTAVTATALAAAGFLVPFAFVYGPPLLLDGSAAQVGLAALTGLAGVVALGAAAMGYGNRPLLAWERGALVVAAAALVVPGWATDLFGAGVLAVTLLRPVAAAAWGRGAGAAARTAAGTNPGPGVGSGLASKSGTGTGALPGSGTGPGSKGSKGAGAGLPVCAALLAGSLLAGCGGPGDSGEARFLSIGTGGTGGIYYPLGGALASLLSKADSGRRYTAEVTGGSVENVNRVLRGEMDLGFAIGTTVHEAYHGVDPAARRLRIAAPLYPNPTHVLVRAGSGIQSLAELRGRRVSLGAAGSGTEQLARHVLEAAGLGQEDVSKRFLSFSESAAALRDGAIDAAILSGGFPAAAVLEATASRTAYLVAIDSTAARKLVERYPYYSAAALPAGAYPGVDRGLPSIAVMNWIVAREDLDARVVGRLLDVLLRRRAELTRAHEIVRQIDLTALRRASIPLHPAARDWWESCLRAATCGAASYPQ
ncbi:MAG: TAXI family TRAP transporter solute-binding subunit, partial [Gemmatimonadetes bacterium]|nr:TAXI family TRAP transporter solute-binding subunit [Gemmatimonadota bacterium]